LALQKAARKLKNNPYQISKATGMPLTTAQHLLKIKTNGPLRNTETLALALGLKFKLIDGGSTIVKPAKRSTLE